MPAPKQLALDPSSAPALSPAEFARSFERHARLFWTVAAGVVGERAEVDDIVQDACGIALEKLDEFDPATSFAAWMAQIVRFVALNHGRARRKFATADERELERLWQAPPSAPASVALDLHGAMPSDEGAFDDAVVRALRTLAPVARTCLLLRSVQELEYREIAGLLAIPEGTAMSHVHRARAAMRTQLERDEPRADGGRA